MAVWNSHEIDYHFVYNFIFALISYLTIIQLIKVLSYHQKMEELICIKTICFY